MLGAQSACRPLMCVAEKEHLDKANTDAMHAFCCSGCGVHSHMTARQSVQLFCQQIKKLSKMKRVCGPPVSYKAHPSLAAEEAVMHVRCCCLMLQLAGSFRVVPQSPAYMTLATAWRQTVSYMSSQRARLVRRRSWSGLLGHLCRAQVFICHCQNRIASLRARTPFRRAEK